MQNEENFADDVFAYFHNLPNAHLLLKKKQEFAIIYEDLTQDYPLWVFFIKDEKDLEPSYGDDLILRDADLLGWEVVAVK